MKSLFTTFSALALAFSLTLTPAQSKEPKHGKHHGNWSPEIKERFQAARTKALEDPALQELRSEARAANEKFFQAIREKMSEIDPGLAEIVRKKREEKGDRSDGKPGGNRSKGPKASSGMDRPGKSKLHRSAMGALNDSERQTLKAAREKAQSDPAVQAAQETKKSAKSPQDRKAAAAAYRKAVHEAMLKADPAIEPILKKLAPKPKPAPAADKKSETDDEMGE